MSHLSSTWGRRSAAALATTSLVVAGLGFTTAPANAHPAGDRAVNAGATWLKAQLTNSLVHNDQFGGFDDYGLSADFALALKAVGGHDATVTQIADAVAPNVTTWYDSFGTVYTGSAAKAAVLAQVAGKDATNFGGQNLQTVIEDRVATAAPIVGRVQNTGETDWQPPYAAMDSLNVIGQSFAARALTTLGSAKAGAVTSFLLKQQCDAGFFRATMSADKGAAEQGCVTGAADSDPGVNTTAIAVINLLDTQGASATTQALAGAGAAWLKTQQAADGSFSAGATEGYNANSTGLAGWALAKAGDTASAAKAAGWLRGLQIADLAPCATTLAAENGGVAYKATELATARTAGSIAAGKRDQFRRATAQALPALAHVPAGTGPLTVSAPATAVEKSSVTVTVAGLGAGEAGCVTFGSVAKPVTGNGGNVAVTFDLPAGAAAHTFTLATLAGTQSAVTNSTLTPVVTPPVLPFPEVGALIASKVELVKKNKFKLSVMCDATVACDGKIVVRTTRKVKVGDTRARKVLIAKKSYSVAPGTTEKVVLKVRKPARPALDSGRIRVKAVQTAVDAEPAVTKFWLRSK